MNLPTIIVAVLLVLAYFFLDPAKPLFPPDYQSGHVKYAVDGDTLVLSNRRKRIRLWGVDAPELNEEGGQQSKVALARLVEGKTIRFIEIEEDRYGRTVARVFVGELEINRRMIESQHADEYCRYSKGFYKHCQ